MRSEILKLRAEVKENYLRLSTKDEQDRALVTQYEKLDKALSDAETSVLAIKYLEL